MTLQATQGQRFIRKTQLGANEYRKNFRQIDCDVMAVITSAEADRVTPLMSKIYLRIVNAPERFWERDGVLRIEAVWREGKRVKAWTIICELLAVASATASKALKWMHEQGIIGYFSGKNGVGLRIFLNRAVSSIGVRHASVSKKILVFAPASPNVNPASSNEAAFNDSYAVKETLDKDINPVAPKNGAGDNCPDKSPSQPNPPERNGHLQAPHREKQREIATRDTATMILEDVILRLRGELEPAIHAAARQAAACEHARTREWLEQRGLPKAARVAQREAFNVLRRYGLVSERQGHANVGRGDNTAICTQQLAAKEILELAEACIALLELKGQSVEHTVTEMCVERGGFLSPEDAVRVREKANELLNLRDGGEAE